MLPLHCFNVVVQFEFEFFKFEFKLNLFESLAKKKASFSLKPQAGPAFFPLFFLPRRPVRFPLPQPFSHSSRPISSSGPSPTPPPPAAHRQAGPACRGLPRARDGPGLSRVRPRPETAPRLPSLARTPRQPQPPLFKRRDLPWNPIDQKPPPLARANPNRHCRRARSGRVPPLRHSNLAKSRHRSSASW